MFSRFFMIFYFLIFIELYLFLEVHNDFRQFFRVIHHIQLRASYQGDASGYKIIVEIAISKGSTVSGYQKTGILKIGGLDRSQFNLHRPLGQPALHGNGFFRGKGFCGDSVFPCFPGNAPGPASRTSAVMRCFKWGNGGRGDIGGDTGGRALLMDVAV